MESASEGAGYAERVSIELARVRDALDDLRRRPLPLDAGTLRHVVTASLSEANAPPPNLLVTAIRRLDRVDARLESIEAALASPGALPRGGTAGSGATPARSLGPASPVSYMAPPPDAEAIAEALARRLTGALSPPSATPADPGGTAPPDVIAALRALIPGAARTVLRRSGREPSPQAVEVLQQTALLALEEAAATPSAFAAPPGGPRPAPPVALAPAPVPAPVAPAPPPPPPLDVAALASAVAARVTSALAAEFRPASSAPPPPARQPDPPVSAPPPVDPKAVADAVVNRLAGQPAPPAVVSPTAMAPLLSAVGNVEAAVARLAEPEADVMVAVDRLEAGVEALARALEDDRSAQAEEVRRGFVEVNELVRTEVAALLRAVPVVGDSPGSDRTDESDRAAADPDGPAAERPGAALPALAGVERRLDRLDALLEPLAQVDLAAAVPALTAQGEHLERSVGHLLTALAALADNLHEQSTMWRTGFDRLAAPPQAAGAGQDIGRLAAQLDELMAGSAADHQRFARLGGTIDGLAELLGQVSARLDRLPVERPAHRPVDAPPQELGPTFEVGGEAAPAEAPPAGGVPGLVADDGWREVTEPAAIPVDAGPDASPAPTQDPGQDLDGGDDRSEDVLVRPRRPGGPDRRLRRRWASRRVRQRRAEPLLAAEGDLAPELIPTLTWKPEAGPDLTSVEADLQPSTDLIGGPEGGEDGEPDAAEGNDDRQEGPVRPRRRGPRSRRRRASRRAQQLDVHLATGPLPAGARTSEDGSDQTPSVLADLEPSPDPVEGPGKGAVGHDPPAAEGHRRGSGWTDEAVLDAEVADLAHGAPTEQAGPGERSEPAEEADDGGPDDNGGGDDGTNAVEESGRPGTRAAGRTKQRRSGKARRAHRRR